MERLLNRMTHSGVAVLAGLCLAFALPAAADPPSRAIRISLVAGSASFSPAGSDRWVQARINRPIWIGDRVWSGDGRVELQLGGASLRLAPRTSIQVLNFDDRLTQIEMTQGSVALHVRTIDSNDAIEINTPSFAFVTQQQGDYRIDVERDRTAVAARRGHADVYGAEVAYRIDRRERFVFFGSDLRDYDVVALGAPDPFDSWVRERSMREDRSASARYVSPELVGYVDLDSHGDWRTDASFGNVWVPRVSADWAPYRYGHWSWIDPWGWTWVDDAPWGWAPSHYGRWTQLGSSWAWVPGPRNVAPVYAPALVAWVGGDNFSLSISSGRTRGIGWFPLAPGEVWRPSYEASREYFTRVNVANTVVNNTTIVNVYNQRNDVRITNVDYRFRAAPTAVTAVPFETFVRSQPVQQQNVRVNTNVIMQAPVVSVAPAQPVVQSFIGPAPATQARPPAETLQRQVIARTAPAAAAPTLENRAALVKDRGQPIDRAALERAAPQAARPAPQGAPAPGATASPGSPQPAGPAPQATAAPGQVRSNVRVVDAEKVKPAAAPQASSEGRRGRGDEPKGRAAPEKAQPAAASTPQPPQPAAPPAAQPPREPTAQPGQAPTAPPPQATPPRETPRDGRDAAPPARAQPTPVQPAQPAPQAKPEPERPPAVTPSKPETPSRAGPPLPQERTDRGGRSERERGEPPASPAQPESRPQPREAAPAQPAPPAQRVPDQGREPRAGPGPEPRAAPAAPPPSRPQAEDNRRGGPPPAKPAAAPEPAKPTPPAPAARPEPAAPPAKVPPAEARRDGEKGKDERRKDKDKDEEKDKEKRSN